MDGFAGALPESPWFPDSLAFPGMESPQREERALGYVCVCVGCLCDARSIIMGGAGNTSAAFFQDPQMGSGVHKPFGILYSPAFCGPTN